jgi:putative IMPACT (imprinted ancient) family translation regulator
VDDGEPGGTAGRPMLDVLRHQDLEGVLAAVVRYYGGIKLGAGGLVRAYTDAVAQALLTVEKQPIVRYTDLRCTLPYSLEGVLRRELAAAGASLAEVVHGEHVTLAFRIAEPAAAALRMRLDEAASGQLEWLGN